MDTALLIGSCSRQLGARVADVLKLKPIDRTVDRFPDGELRVQLEESVRQRDVYILQATGPLVDANLMELLLLVDACRRAGAGRITAVVPYFGYARQDRRVHGREPLSARLVADLLGTAGVECLVAIDLHAPSLEGVFGFPVEPLSAAPLLVEKVRQLQLSRPVVVAPDLGAVRRAEYFASKLGMPMAVVHKMRLSGAEVIAERVTGDVLAMTPVIVDDMIVTGGTIEAAVQQLLKNGSQANFTVVATHGVFDNRCVARLNALPVRSVIVTDTLSREADFAVGIDVQSVDQLIADAIVRLHFAYPMGEIVGLRA